MARVRAPAGLESAGHLYVETNKYINPSRCIQCGHCSLVQVHAVVSRLSSVIASGFPFGVPDEWYRGVGENPDQWKYS